MLVSTVLFRSVGRRWRWLFAFLLFIGGFLLLRGSAVAIERPDLKRALLATVRVASPVAGETDTYSTGSGTILTSDGIILTNLHVMADEDSQELFNPDGLAFIAINPSDLRGAPVWTYRATMIRGSSLLDLAVLKIDGFMDDPDTPLPANLGLTTIPMAISDEVQIGDEVNTFGFPSLGQGTVTYTSGNISGFLDEDADGVFEWFKTDADISRGNSGGLATNADGDMIGIPTAGFADVETASSISLIRPSDLSLPVIRAALNSNAEGGERGKEGNVRTSGPRISGVQFAEAIDRGGNPINPTLRFEDVGIVYAVFEYDNFPKGKGAVLEYVWNHNGSEVIRDSFEWEAGTSGQDWVNIYSEETLPDGSYQLELLLDDQSLYEGGFAIGEAANADLGTFGDITFAKEISSDGLTPLNPGTRFSDVEAIYAFFEVVDVPDGALWTRRWFVDGEMATELEQVWEGGSGDWWISLSKDEGLPLGHYRLELLLEDDVVQAGEFDIVESSAIGVEPVVVRGNVVEEDNKRKAVSGASIYFLVPGVLVDAFLENPEDSLIYAFGISDEDGNYQLDQPLIPGEFYGAVVYHEQYRLVTVDDYQIDPEAVSPWEIDITMKRR